MPKKTTAPKKAIAKKTPKKLPPPGATSTVTPGGVASNDINAKSPVVRLRVFECLVHLDVSISLLANVGIFTGSKREECIRLKRLAEQALEDLRKAYRVTWSEQVENFNGTNNAS